MLLNQRILALIRSLWDRFWAGGISNPLSAIEQITYLLFIKRIDLLDTQLAAEAAKARRAFTSRFTGRYVLPSDRRKAAELEKSAKVRSAKVKVARLKELKSLNIDRATLRWSYIQSLPAEQALDHVRDRVFPFIKDLKGKGDAFTRHMTNAVFIIPSPNLLKSAMDLIDLIFVEIDKDAREQGHLHQDIQGDVYEMLLNEISSAGKNGQFRTPRHVIKLVTELVDPKLGHQICDPACGTAGFLLDASHYIVTARSQKNRGRKKPPAADEDGFIRAGDSTLFTTSEWCKLEHSLHGYDFDGTMVRLALMNLMMHGIENPYIDYQDTLSKGFTQTGDYDIIMANPPFTGSIDKGDINESLTLRSKTSKTELLFIERIFSLLKPGGTAGVIIPQGVLFGSTGAFVETRRMLVENAELRAVILLPSGVFKPYAGVATAILLFTRMGRTEHTWFYNVTNDGRSLDDKRQRISGSQFPDVVARYKIGRTKAVPNYNVHHFFVPVEDIRANNYDLSFNRYSKQAQEDTVHAKPRSILTKLKEVEVKIQRSIAELEEILG